MSKTDKKGFLQGAIIGGLVAGIGALLFAPKSGKETRADIAKGAKKVANDISGELGVVHDELQKRATKLKAASKDLKGQAAKDAKVLIEKAEGLKADIKVATANIGEVGAEAKSEVVENATMVLASGKQVLQELELFAKKTASSASQQVKKAVK